MNNLNPNINPVKNDKEDDIKNRKKANVNIILEPKDSDWKAWDEIIKDIAQKIKNVETHQLRKIYGEIEKIKHEYKKGRKNINFYKKRLLMIKVRLAYTVAKKSNLQTLYDYMINIVDDLLEETDYSVFYVKLSNFFDFIEGIMAYHRFFKETETGD